MVVLIKIAKAGIIKMYNLNLDMSLYLENLLLFLLKNILINYK